MSFYEKILFFKSLAIFLELLIMNSLYESIDKSLMNINLTTSINSDIIFVAEMVLIIISVIITSGFVFMLTSSGLLHIHFKLLIRWTYLFFILSMITRLVIIIGILFNIENSGK